MVMATAIAKRGRPYLIPEVAAISDKRLRLYDAFYRVCASFHYREIYGWARLLGVHPFTVERWKYKMTFPGDHIAQQIIDWDGDGRPWKKVEVWKGTSGMFER